MEQVDSLLSGIREGAHRLIARGISLVENDYPTGTKLLQSLDIHRNKPVVGITGPPGAGKSTLTNALVKHLLENGKQIAVVAVDPSSPFNFGALLGDRIRLNEFFNHPKVFIRSLATRGSLGGLSDKILQVTDLLRAAPFDYIIVETVGVGQSEVEIAGLADITVVVMVPESGDEIQTMKAGLMEIADIFVVNKADRPDANLFLKNLQSMVHGRHHPSGIQPPVLKTIAHQNIGVGQLATEILKMKSTVNKERQEMLLAAQALKLIQAERMKSLDKRKLLAEIRQELSDNNQFNLYQLIQRFI